MSLALKSGVSLAALATALSLSGAPNFGAIPTPTAPSATTEWRGYLAALDAGTAGDVFVSPTGSDANPGTLAQPKLTLSTVINGNPGKLIRVLGGPTPYRQVIDLTAAASGTAGSPTRVMRYGTDEVRVSGAEVLSGLTRCTSGDAPVIGAIWADARLYKVTLADSAIASGDPSACAPLEAGKMMALASELIASPRAPIEPYAIDDWQTWQVVTTGDAVATTGQPIIGYKNPSITDKYSQAELQAMSVSFYGSPNLAYLSAVASFDPTKKILYLTNQAQLYEGTVYKDRMSLRNIPKALKQGQWAYVRNGDGTSTYYLFLANAANAASGVEYCARVRNLQCGNANYLYFEGITFERTASATTGQKDDHQAICKQVVGGNQITTDVKFYNCRVRQHYRSRSRETFGVYMNDVNNFWFRQSSVTECFGMYGIHPEGNSNATSLATMTHGMWIERCRFENISATGIRIYQQGFGAVFHSIWATNVGISPHANKIDPKQYSHAIWVHGCDFSGAMGYITWQHASGFHLTCCYNPGNYNAGDSRNVSDQNGAATNPAGSYGVSGQCYFLNNHFAPDPQDTNQTNALKIGSISNVTFLLDNNIMFGVGAGISAALVTRGSGNVVTQGAYLPTETFEGKALAYENPAIGDFRIKASSVIRRKAGNDRSAEIAAILAQLPQVTGGVQNLDINGDPINWAAPPVGPSVTYVVNTTAAHFITLPSLAGGSPAVGLYLTMDNGLYVPAHLPLSRQWLRSADGAKSFSAKSGATGVTDTVIMSELGQIPACDTTLGSLTVRSVIPSPIIAAYPLGTPVPAFAILTDGVNRTTYEGATFDVQDRPLLILYACRTAGANNVKSPATVSIGTPGRTSGGTVIPNAPTTGEVIRGNAQVGAAFVRSPGALAAQAVQINVPVGCASMAILGLYIDGATGIGPVNGNGATAYNISLTKVSTLASGLMAWMGCRHDATFTLGMTGATVLNEGLAGSATTDQAFSFGYELAPAVGPYQASVSGSKSSSLILGGVEIFS